MARRLPSDTTRSKSSTRAAQSGIAALTSAVSVAGRTKTSVTPGSSSNTARSIALRLPTARTDDQPIGRHDADLGRQPPEREADHPLGIGRRQPHG